jgi:hypothetical protein
LVQNLSKDLLERQFLPVNLRSTCVLRAAGLVNFDGRNPL